MAERFGNCLIGLIVGKDLKDKHKRWRLDRDNNRKLEIQSRFGTRPTPTTAHAAAVCQRSLRRHAESSLLELDPIPDHSGAAMPPGLGFALAPVASSTPISTTASGSQSRALAELLTERALDLLPVPAGAPVQGSVTEPAIRPVSQPMLSSVSVNSAVPALERSSMRKKLATVPVDLSASAKPQILMPNRHYLNVHSHYARVPVHVEIDEANDRIKISGVLQSCDYGCLDADPLIGFRKDRSKGRTRVPRVPARKAVDLEKLSPLSSALAEEARLRNKLREQAVIAAKNAKQREKDAEIQRRANRAPQHQVPPFNMRVGPLYRRNDSKFDVLTPPITPATSPSRLHKSNFQVMKEQQAYDAPLEKDVRLALNLLQQQQKPILRRRQRPPIAEERRPPKAKSTLRKVRTGSAGRCRS